MTEFVWRDGDRTIRFGPGAPAAAWTGADLLTTARAEAGIPDELRAGSRVHHVPAGQVPDLAAALIDRVGAGPIVAWGGGRVIDTAKALASARGGRVCAVPTTLSGAEMSQGHRPAPGFEDAPRCRPVLILADPELMTGQPDADRRASAMNALAHAVEALYGPGRNPVASLAAARAAALLARGIDAGERSDLALGAILAGYALGSAELSLHHVLCQTIVRICGTAHAHTNAAVLPHVIGVMVAREPDAMADLAAALGAGVDDLPARVSALAGGGGLAGLGVERGDLPAVVDAALARPELTAMPDPPSRDELILLLERAL